jgi:hypothetical protein
MNYQDGRVGPCKPLYFQFPKNIALALNVAILYVVYDF